MAAYARLPEADRARTMPPRPDLELQALAEILAGTRLVHSHSYRQDEIMMLLRVAEDFGFRVATLQHVLEGYKVAAEIARHGAGASTFSDWWAYKVEVMDAIPWNGQMLQAAGVVTSFNSDSDELARRLNVEAAKAVRYGGLPREEAIKFVTLNPAKQLRIDNRVGTLEPGKDADFAIWSGDPLSVYSRCEQTWIDGERLFDRKADAALRARDDATRRAILALAAAGDVTPPTRPS
jgi:imidazolonepropionase-like amidohydrolase